jgi:DNA mismatch endonuclease, patch repair protein
MPDCFVPAMRSAVMRAVKGSNTRLEVGFRSLVWASGLRYRLSSRLPGKPDLVFPAARVAVFVDSCFWHACPKHCRFPKSNRAYWLAKLQRNKKRDRLVNVQCRNLGWTAIRVWEHSIKTRPDACVARIKAAVLLAPQSRHGREHAKMAA